MYSQIDISKTLRGSIMVDSGYMGQVNVVNQTLNLSTTSNEVGRFNIMVKEGDLLVFTAVNLVTLRKTIAANDIVLGELKIQMNYKSIPLDEVIIAEPSSITAESLGIIPYGQKKYTQAERKLYTATSGNGIDGLLNTISGRKAMLKKVIVVEAKQTALNRLVYLFEDEFYIDQLKIPADYISGFQYYCVEDTTFVSAIESKNKTLAKFLIGILAEKYKKINKDEKGS
ncbi:hypothetical protein HNQ02_000310 [Flavobacterium sp. 7E]|uniref:hypothetical protein n=1 Tax=Flavobacterium sp. 7E TaxID=2735898 RepID=UPI001C2DC3C7|nr:hypothetical protein [Flavobacterium sp. 7E]NRS87410.1 hypothetical protein [Flavobacterium sp. 7E]